MYVGNTHSRMQYTTRYSQRAVKLPSAIEHHRRSSQVKRGNLAADDMKYGDGREEAHSSYFLSFSDTPLRFLRASSHSRLTHIHGRTPN